MMPKAGLIHDYDFMANREESAHGVTCAVCDTPSTTFQWSDYNGEGMCCVCGCPYQLMNGSDEMKKEGKYPYLSLLDAFVPIARQYWAETQRWVHYGMSLSRNDGLPELDAWMEKHHPDYGKKSEDMAAEAEEESSD